MSCFVNTTDQKGHVVQDSATLLQALQDTDEIEFQQPQNKRLKVEAELRPISRTTEEFASKYDRVRLPIWLSRPTIRGGYFREIFWANRAARDRFGSPLDPTQVSKRWQTLSTASQDCMRKVMMLLTKRVEEDKQNIRLNVNMTKALFLNFSNVPVETFACLFEQAVDVRIDGRVEACCLTVLERDLNIEELRSAAISTFSPIHSYLFDAAGLLLYANEKAALKVQSAGCSSSENFTLADLLCQNGHSQPALAAEALAAVITRNEPHHRVTLSSVQPSGKARYILYEMWPAKDPVDGLAPAMVVSTFNVTSVKQTELELHGMKLNLQRRNADLQQQVQTVEHGKADLECQRLALQARLKEALQLHMIPRINVSTVSPIDKTVSLLDGLLEGRQPSTEQILLLRNTLLQSGDLRQPSDLEKQIKSLTGMSEDAGRSLVAILKDDSHTASKRLANRFQSSGSNTASNSRWSAQPDREHAVGTSESPVQQQPDSPGNDSGLPRTTSSILKSITPYVEALLQDAQRNWAFDMYTLDEATGHHALSCFSFFVYKQSGLIEHFAIIEERWADYLKSIEAGYNNKNPYHNSVHAACVLHQADLLLRGPRGLSGMGLTDHILVTSLYMAAIFHDYGHPGVTNDYLIKTRDPLAVLYNDKSPLESHHAAASFALLYKQKRLQTVEAKDAYAQRQVVRAMVIDLILATDMKQHFSLVSRLQGALHCGAFTQKPTPDEAKNIPSDQNDLRADNVLLILQAALKCADLGHWVLPRHMHCKWVGRLQEEFYAQGDRERAAGMPVSALMDREKCSSLASSQVGFFEVIAMPLFTSMVQVVPGAQAMLDAATSNYMHWRSQSDG